MRRTVPPSAEIEAQIDRLLAVVSVRTPGSRCLSWRSSGPGLIIQRAVEDEFDAWLGRARYERRPDYRVRNLLAKLPERVRQAYWRALDDATNERDGRQRL